MYSAYGSSFKLTEISLSFSSNLFEILDSDKDEVLFSVIVHPGRRYTLKIGDHSFNVKWQSVYDESNGKYYLQYKTEGINTDATVDIIRNYDNNDAIALITTSKNENMGISVSESFDNNNRYSVETLTSVYQFQNKTIEKKCS